MWQLYVLDVCLMMVKFLIRLLLSDSVFSGGSMRGLVVQREESGEDKARGQFR